MIACRMKKSTRLVCYTAWPHSIYVATLYLHIDNITAFISTPAFIDLTTITISHCNTYIKGHGWPELIKLECRVKPALQGLAAYWEAQMSALSVFNLSPYIMHKVIKLT